MILQARNQPVKREGVGQRGDGAVECRRALEASPAHLAGGRGGGALRAVGLGMPGQFAQTARAQGAELGRSPAKQASMRG